jgi:hypothetical protein
LFNANTICSDVDACVEAGMLLVDDLYDPKGSATSVHRDLNKLRVKLALSKDSSLVKLPPSEAAFRQQILRVAYDKFCSTQTQFLLQMDLPLHTHTGSCKKSDVMGPSKYSAFRQHILRVAFQVYAWTHANEAKPPPRSPLEYGWRNENSLQRE